MKLEMNKSCNLIIECLEKMLIRGDKVNENMKKSAILVMTSCVITSEQAKIITKILDYNDLKQFDKDIRKSSKI